MIYQIYFTGVWAVDMGTVKGRALKEKDGTEKTYTSGEVFKNLLEKTHDRLVLIVTRTQYPQLKQWLKAFNLEEYVEFLHAHKEGVTNPNYPDDTAKLKLCVLKGKGE